jgi:hypothetical protein
LATWCIAGILAGSDGLGAAIQRTKGGNMDIWIFWNHIDTTNYIDWKDKVDIARNHALHHGDTTTMKYNLHLVESIEEAIWAEEIILQDEALDAECLLKCLSSTWFANYQYKKRSN